MPYRSLTPLTPITVTGKDYIPLSQKIDKDAQLANYFMHNLKVTLGFPGKVIYHPNFLYKPF